MSGINLAEVLRRKFEETENGPSLPLPEAQIATLREIYARYAAGCPFKPGDLVTPRAGYNAKREGVPHIVVEIGAPPGEPSFPADPSETFSMAYGRRIDMRVIAHSHVGDIAAWWVESWVFEAWEGAANA